MGKAGRFACIFVPMALTIASLICLILIFMAQLNKDSSIQTDLYFFKADTEGFTENPNLHLPDIPKTNFDNELLAALQGANAKKDLKDFYQVGLWNYCEGDIDDKTKKQTVTYCSPRQAHYWFNPIDVWQLKNTTAQKVFGDKMQDGLDAYKKVSGWMFSAYVIAICLTAAEFVVGIFAIFSRWGSFVTTCVSTAQTVFMFAAAVTSTALYASLVGVFDTALKPVNIKASMGGKMLSVIWLGVAFSLCSGFFWTISVCCCSGKSGHKKTVVEKTPYTYERVASPYLGAREAHNPHVAPAHGTSGSAYEPFRHNQV